MFVTLLYHIINHAISDRIAISEEAFEAQLSYLRQAGCNILTLEQAIDSVDRRSIVGAGLASALATGPAPTLATELAPTRSSQRSVLLTFDDGYAETVHTALPLLRAYNMTATLFMLSAYIGQTNRWNPRACYDARHLTWEELQCWLDAGCDLGGHSHAHLCMTRLDEHEMHDAVLLNKHLLEDHLHTRLRAFSYPYGKFNQVTREVVSKQYELAFSVHEGSWNAQVDRHAINRLEIEPGWSIEEFAKRLDEAHRALLA